MTTKTKKPTFTQRTAKVITKENAEAWAATTDKYAMVTDLLAACDVNYDPQGKQVTKYVASIERRLEKLLADKPAPKAKKKPAAGDKLKEIASKPISAKKAPAPKFTKVEGQKPGLVARFRKMDLYIEKVSGKKQAFVESTGGNYSASLACAANEGELTHVKTGVALKLTDGQMAKVKEWADEYPL